MGNRLKAIEDWQKAMGLSKDKWQWSVIYKDAQQMVSKYQS